MKFVNQFNLLAKLAWRDLSYDRKVSFCIIASLIAVITPLLLLFSLKYGVVSQLRHQLLNNPSTLEIKMEGNLQLKQDWFDWLNQQPETQFSVPLTRSLNTQVDLRVNSTTFINNIEIIPTAQGDPLLQGLPLPTPQQIILTSKAAQQLKLKVGDEVFLIATRNFSGVSQNQRLALKVSAILPAENFERLGAFVHLNILVGIEDFRDGIYTALFPEATGEAREMPREHFSRARIYAKSLEDVEPLAQKLQQKHINTLTAVKKIQEVKAIDNVLNLIFMVISGTSILGCILSLIGAFLANIDRKRKEIALLGLLGFRGQGVICYLMLQAVMLSSIAFVASYGCFLVGSQVFNRVLAANLSQSHFISSLQPIHLLLAFVIAFILSALVAAIGAIQAVKIQPAESLRDV